MLKHGLLLPAWQIFEDVAPDIAITVGQIVALRVAKLKYQVRTQTTASDSFQVQPSHPPLPFAQVPPTPSDTPRSRREDGGLRCERALTLAVWSCCRWTCSAVRWSA